MRRIEYFFILAGATFSLTACKTDKAPGSTANVEETQKAPPPAVFAKPNPTPQGDSSLPLIVCFGDSLTAGFGADEGASYPDFLQRSLDRDGYHYRVVNEGISGNTTKDGVDRLPGILAMKPAVVIVEFGGNDGLRGLKVQSTRDNLNSMLDALKRAHIKVVLAGISLPPDYGPDYIASFNAMYPTLAKKYQVPVLPFLLKDVYGVPGMMQADRTHATNKGNEIVASNVLPLVEPLLKK